MYTTLQPVLDMLDEGLRLYRRGFTVFVLLTAIWIVPVAIGSGLFIAIDQSWGMLLTLLLALPLGIYIMGGLSQATLAVQQHRVPTLREALRIAPLRLLGMGCYTTLFALVSTVAVFVAIGMCFCGGFALLMFFGSAAIAMESTGSAGMAFSVVLGFIIILLFVLLYVLGLVLVGAIYSSVVYSLQPFVQQRAPFGDTVERSLRLLGYRPGSNMLTFLLTSAIFGATALAITTTMGTFLPLPLLLLLGEESPLAQGMSASAWLVGLIVVLPPVPIWMALLYQRNAMAREGYDLANRIATATREGTIQ
jgi:hypothetical protein